MDLLPPSGRPGMRFDGSVKRKKQATRETPFEVRYGFRLHQQSATTRRGLHWHGAWDRDQINSTRTCTRISGVVCTGPTKLPATGGTASGRRLTATAMCSGPVSRPLVES